MAEYNEARIAAAAAPNFVPQGGQWAEAEPGVAALGRAIAAWWKTRPGGGLDVPRTRPYPGRGLDVVLPAGTGTVALFLARHVPADVRVYAVPCRGDAEGLRQRMEYLDARSGAVGAFPRVLSPPPAHAVRFGAVAAPLLATWRDATYCGVLLDLVYGPVAWAALEGCGWRPGGASERRELLYVNTGGQEALTAQMQRYARAGLLRRMGGFSLETGAWEVGQWEVGEVVGEARRIAAAAAGLGLHTRDAGL